MMRKFKDPLYVRVISVCMVVISFPYAILHYNNLYEPLFFILFLLLAVEINYTSYSVTEEELIIKKPFKKIISYKLMDIKRIEETKGLLPFLKIFLNTKKRPVAFLNNKMDKFILVILESLKDKKKLEFDQNEKWVNFLTQ